MTPGFSGFVHRPKLPLVQLTKKPSYVTKETRLLIGFEGEVLYKVYMNTLKSGGGKKVPTPIK